MRRGRPLNLRQRIWHTRALALAAALWVVPPLIVGVAFAPGEQEERALWSAESAPRWGRVGMRTLDAAQGAVLRVVVSDSAPVGFGPLAASGTLSTLSISVGDEITNGREVARVDGRSVLAYVSPTPQYRTLGVGDFGPDVAALDEWLVATALTAESTLDTDGRFSRATQSAVKELESRSGWPSTGRFSPSYVVFVPEERTHVTALLATVGAAVGPGVELFESGRRPVMASIEPQGAASERLMLERGTSLRLATGSADVVVDGLELAGGDIDRLASAGVLDLGEVAIDSSTSAVEVGGYRIALAVPVSYATAPGQAVIVRAGATCVRVRGSSSGPERVVAVTIDARTSVNEQGIALLDPALAGMEILLNPSELATCG